LRNERTSLLGLLAKGFFVLLPFLITYLMLGQFVDMLLALTQPLMDVLPGTLVPDVGERKIVAAGILVVVFLAVGLIADTSWARRLGTWLEEGALGWFPPYLVLKSLSARLAGRDEKGLHPALMETAPGTRMLVAIVEELSDGNVTVFVPMSPTPGIGVLQIVNPARLERLECSMADALGWPLNWGTGTEAILAGRDTARENGGP
jgi:uncharacterized membrane protein